MHKPAGAFGHLPEHLVPIAAIGVYRRFSALWGAIIRWWRWCVGLAWAVDARRLIVVVGVLRSERREAGKSFRPLPEHLVPIAAISV